MKKILYVPLDDRPCNYLYPSLIAKIADDIKLLTPPFSLMGKCKRAGNSALIWEWLFKEAPNADYAVLSVDTLVYGNIIHSRIHNRTMDEINMYLNNFEKLNSINPALKIEAFNLVARAAAYNDSFEDPDYWDTYGESIWKYGYLKDKIARNAADDAEKAEFEKTEKVIPQEYLNDFLERREKDLYVNLYCAELTQRGIFNRLVIPKDDTAEYGYAAMDQRKISAVINEKELADRIMVYPGADEVGSVLLSRVFCLIHNYKPRIFVRYSSVLGPTVVPRYEDRPLGESVKAQITSAGGIVCDTAAESDLLFAVHSPGKIQEECCTQQNKDISYATHCCLPEFFNYIKYYNEAYSKPIALSDVAFSNGADTEMMRYAKKAGILNMISAYGGWNTSENTNGMCLAHIIIHSYYAKHGFKNNGLLRSEEFAARKIAEDYLFQAQTMLSLYSLIPEKFGGCSPRYCAEIEKEAAELSGSLLVNKLNEEFGGRLFNKNVVLGDFTLPWDRINELGFTLSLV